MAVPVKIDLPAVVDFYTFLHEHCHLDAAFGLRGNSNLAARVDDAMPGELMRSTGCVQNAHDLAGCSRLPCKRGDPSICHYLTVRNGLNDRDDLQRERCQAFLLLT